MSYARDDSDFALRLGTDLREVGVNIWIDQLDVPLGQNWDDVTEQALDACESLLLILSPISVASRNVKDEIAFAIEEGKRIVPVLYQACKVPLRIRRLQRSDFFSDYAIGLKQVMNALGLQNQAGESDRTDFKTVSKRNTANPKTEAGTGMTITISQYRLRGSPATLDDVTGMLRKWNFYDRYKNKTGQGIANDFERKEDVVYDTATGLTWQQADSGESMRFKSAKKYISRVNNCEFAGYNDWRLPTLEEAMSLVEQHKNANNLHIHPVFRSTPVDASEPLVGRVWTADTKSYLVIPRVWQVDFGHGDCAAADAYNIGRVRAVRRPALP